MPATFCSVRTEYWLHTAQLFTVRCVTVFKQCDYHVSTNSRVEAGHAYINQVKQAKQGGDVLLVWLCSSCSRSRLGAGCTIVQPALVLCTLCTLSGYIILGRPRVGRVLVGVWPIDMQPPPPPIHNSNVSYTTLASNTMYWVYISFY